MFTEASMSEMFVESWKKKFFCCLVVFLLLPIHAVTSWADYEKIPVLQAKDIPEALRLKPARLFVIRRGTVIAETPPVLSQLKLEDKTLGIDFSFKGKY